MQRVGVVNLSRGQPAYEDLGTLSVQGSPRPLPIRKKSEVYISDFERKEYTFVMYEWYDGKSWHQLNVIDSMNKLFEVSPQQRFYLDPTGAILHPCGCECFCSGEVLSSDLVHPNAPRLDGKKFCEHNRSCHLYMRVQHLDTNASKRKREENVPTLVL